MKRLLVLALTLVVLTLSIASCSPMPQAPPPVEMPPAPPEEPRDGSPGEEPWAEEEEASAEWDEEEWEPATRDGGDETQNGDPAEDASAPDDYEGGVYDLAYGDGGYSGAEYDIAYADDYEAAAYEEMAESSSTAPSSAGPASPGRTAVREDPNYGAEGRSRHAVAEIPIEFERTLASYAFLTPPGLRYRERLEVLFRVDPSASALEARDAVQRIVDEAARAAPAGQLPTLRGAVEATTGPWSRCMEAELHETTVASKLTALDLDPEQDRTHLEICELGPEGDCLEGPIVARRLGLHPTEWRWRIEGARAGRAQIMLRLYAVAQQENDDGSGECIARDPGRPGSYRRIRTFQHRMTVEVSAAERIEKATLTPWLWSLILPPLGFLFASYRRSRARRVLP